MEIKTLTTKEELKKLEDDSALTIEGLTEESIPDLIDWVKQYTPLINENVYVVKGKTMNEVYGLTESNAYPNDCTLVSIKLVDMENYEKIILSRLEIRGRWFDDIVDNNLRRQKEIDESIGGIQYVQ